MPTQIDAETVRSVAEYYWGERATWAYRLSDQINARCFDGRLPVPMIQWGLTAHGRCLGLTREVGPKDRPVITLHNSIWGDGELTAEGRRAEAWGGVPACRLYAFDVLVHELTHVAARGWSGESSHNNKTWMGEIERVSPTIGLPGIVASRTKMARIPGGGGGMRRVPVKAGSISLKDASTWPYSCRSDEFYDERPDLDFEV